MSSSSTNISLSAIGTDAGISNLNTASIPENIRDGNNEAKEAYSEGLSFESMLVNELTQQLASTMYGGQGDGSDGVDGSDDSSDGSDSSGLSSPASGYSSLISSALTSSIMGNGGLGMAESFAEELDPSLATQASSGTQEVSSS